MHRGTAVEVPYEVQLVPGPVEGSEQALFAFPGVSAEDFGDDGGLVGVDQLRDGFQDDGIVPLGIDLDEGQPGEPLREIAIEQLAQLHGPDLLRMNEPPVLAVPRRRHATVRERSFRGHEEELLLP